MMKLLWKCIPENFESRGHKWQVGKWFHVGGEISTYQNGFHASPTILAAMGYVTPGWICRVKVKGNSQDDGDESAWSDMMIVKRYAWTKEMSVELAIYAAELVIGIFEKEYPDDKRPAEAITAAKKWLKDPSEENRIAANAAANAADAAYTAANAADAAAYAVAAANAAANAADAAYAAANAAANAANAVAYAAYTAAYAVAAANAAAYAVAYAANAAANAVAYAAYTAAYTAANAANAVAYAAYTAANAADAANAVALKKIERKIKQLIGAK